MESTNVMDLLRQGIVTYFNHIIPLLQIREQEFLPVPFPSDPTRLPVDFPHGECFYGFKVEWNDLEHGVQHRFDLKLRHFLPEPGEKYVAWQLLYKRLYADEARVQIGLLVVDRLVYEDRSLLQIDGSFILTSLGLSVSTTEPVYVRKITAVSPNAPYTSLEVVQMDLNGSWIEARRGLPWELARREI